MIRFLSPFFALSCFFFMSPFLFANPATEIEKTLQVSEDIPNEEFRLTFDDEGEEQPKSYLTPLQRLQKMQQVHKEKNYGLYFVLSNPVQLNSYRYYHAKVNQQNFARLTNLDGIQREIILKDNKVTYFSPTSPAMTFPSEFIHDLPPILSANLTALRANYEIIPKGLNRMGDRLVKVFRFVPKDPFRYQLNLFLDSQQHWLMRQDVVDKSGNLLEQLRVVHQVPLENAQQFAEEIQSFDMPMLFSAQNEAKEEKIKQNWKTSWLPKGFKLLSQTERFVDGEKVESQFYSDGLFSFSLNRSKSVIQHAPENSWVQGALTLFTTSRGEFDYTFVGQLPSTTAKRIVEEIKEGN